MCWRCAGADATVAIAEAPTAEEAEEELLNVRERKLEGGGSASGLERADARWGRPGECDCGGR
eukprot:SAG11_NODE_951_length_6407_cov_15.903614_7_plen_63_part_00